MEVGDQCPRSRRAAGVQSGNCVSLGMALHHVPLGNVRSGRTRGSVGTRGGPCPTTLDPAPPERVSRGGRWWHVRPKPPKIPRNSGISVTKIPKIARILVPQFWCSGVASAEVAGPGGGGLAQGLGIMMGEGGQACIRTAVHRRRRGGVTPPCTPSSPPSSPSNV